MSEQSEHWEIHMSRRWARCPKYDILISGCTKNFECKLNGNKPCFSEVGTNTLPSEKSKLSLGVLTTINQHSGVFQSKNTTLGQFSKVKQFNKKMNLKLEV